MPEALPDQTDAAFLQDALTEVNNYRKQHGADPLSLDQDLVTYAKSRAAKMSADGVISHGGLDEKYGENAYQGSVSLPGKPAPAAGATSAWYGEEANYKYNTPEGPHSGVVGHFTALVWKGTTKVGFARAAGVNGEWFDTYIVANFYPAGNMTGDYAKNVSPKQ